MCHARPVAEQMRCRRCDLTWDRDDPEPPQCRADRADWGAFIQSLYDTIEEGQTDES